MRGEKQTVGVAAGNGGERREDAGDADADDAGEEEKTEEEAVGKEEEVKVGMSLQGCQGTMALSKQGGVHGGEAEHLSHGSYCGLRA